MAAGSSHDWHWGNWSMGVSDLELGRCNFGQNLGHPYGSAEGRRQSGVPMERKSYLQ